jgi:hypothetical protein
MAGEVGRVGGGLEHVAKHHMVHLGGLHAGSREGSLGGDCAEIGGGQLLQRTAESAETGTNAGKEYDSRLVTYGVHGM